jgi:hypothetical protein
VPNISRGSKGHTFSFSAYFCCLKRVSPFVTE